MGHTSRDCTAPKDWSRVTCSICNEKGHGAKRCPQAGEAPSVVENAGSGDAGFDAGNTAAMSGNNEWEKGGDGFGSAAPVTVASAW